MVIENLEQLAEQLCSHTEVGLSSILHSCLGERGISLLGPCISEVALRVRATYVEALALTLVPELNRLMSPSPNSGQPRFALRTGSSSSNGRCGRSPPEPSYERLAFNSAASLINPATPDSGFGALGNSSCNSSSVSSERHSLIWPTTAPPQRDGSEAAAFDRPCLAPGFGAAAVATPSPAAPTPLQLLHRGSLDRGCYVNHGCFQQPPPGQPGKLLPEDAFGASLSTISAPNPVYGSPAKLMRAASDAGRSSTLERNSSSPSPWQQELQQQQQQREASLGERRSTGDFRGLTIASPAHTKQQQQQQQVHGPVHSPQSQGKLWDAGMAHSEGGAGDVHSAMSALQIHMVRQERLLMASPGAGAGAGGSSGLSPVYTQQQQLAGAGGSGCLSPVYTQQQQQLADAGGSGCLSPVYTQQQQQLAGVGGSGGLSPVYTQQRQLAGAGGSGCLSPVFTQQQQQLAGAGGSGPLIGSPSSQAQGERDLLAALQQNLRDFPAGQPCAGGGGGAGGAPLLQQLQLGDGPRSQPSTPTRLLPVGLDLQAPGQQHPQHQHQHGGLARRSLPDPYLLHFSCEQNSQQPQLQAPLRSSAPTGSKHSSHPSCSDWLSMSSPPSSLLDLQSAYSAPIGSLTNIQSHQDLEILLGMQGGSAGGQAGLMCGHGPGSHTQQQMQMQQQMLSGSPPPSCSGGGGGGVLSGAAASPGEMPIRFKVLSPAVQLRIAQLTTTSCVITIRDFDDKVVSKLVLLIDSYGLEEALAMLSHLEHRMRTKQGAMKNGPGYLDVAVSSHLDMLKAQGSCPKSMTIDEYAAQALGPHVFHELKEAVANNRWLEWQHLDQGIVQLIKKLPKEGAVEKLQEISCHSFKNVDNIKGCIMSILNSKIREDRRKQ